MATSQQAQSEDGRINNLVNMRKWVTVHHDTYPAIDPLLADLTGKSVVITGASKGVGYATALAFARAGCSKIAISARSPLDKLKSEIRDVAKAAGRAEPLVIAMTVDVTSEIDVPRFAAEVVLRFNNTVDILINNAGYLEEWLPFAETKPAEWWKTWEVNIKGLYLCSRYFLPMVLRSSTKTIINVSSNGAHVTSRGASAYQSSKFAVCRLAEFMTNDYWDEGLVAIAVHPGSVMTELAKGMPEYMHEVLIDTVELPADAMVWLAKERREWLRGRYVMTNWDVNELEAKKDEIVDGDLLKFRLAI
ncbi:C-factor [Orbilia brochopaga]|nr:C-factor [Drechslerella brochopaga]